MYTSVGDVAPAGQQSIKGERRLRRDRYGPGSRIPIIIFMASSSADSTIKRNRVEH